MDKEKDSPAGASTDAGQTLRERAEEIVHARRASDYPPPGEKQLIHELRVHQAELEMQNEELLQRREELETARAKYYAFYNLAPVGYFTISEQGIILETNLTAAGLLGMEKGRLTGQPFTRFIAAEDQDGYYLFHKKLLETGRHQSCDLRMARPDGSRLWARVEAVVTGNTVESGALECHAVMSDITDLKRADDVLRQSEERYRAAFHASKAIELLVDPATGAIIDANDAACRFYGYSREQLTSTFIYQINTLSPDEIKKEMEAAKNEDRDYFNFHHRLASGVIRDVEVYSSPIPISGRKVLHSIIHDITARKRAEEALWKSEALFRNYFDLGQVGMAITSIDQEWLRVNNRLCEILGYAKGELTRMTWTELTHPDDLEPDLTLFRKLLADEGDTYSMDKKFIHKNGGIIHAHIAVACQRKPDRSIEYFIASVEDITARKAAEEKLKAAKEEAEAATALKDKFVSLVAHDLKSPIANSVLALKNLRARLKEEGAPAADDPMLKLSIEANENMLHLIGDLLQVSRIKSGAISPRPGFTDAHYLFQYAADFNAGDAGRKGITLANHVPPRTRLYCDMKLTGEVLVNLISNAIKFSKKGDSITLEKKAGEPSTFFIKDTGVGIPSDRLPSLFKYEMPTSTTGTEGERGTGMGLPLSNEMMQSQGGSLRIESAPNKGTTVVIGFPHVAPKALVVEDANFDMEIARMFLKDIGIQVIEAEGGEEALRLMEGELPHIILLDINLPDIGGFEVLRRKRENPKIAPLPVIVITGSVDPDIAEEVFRLGAVDFIKKPLQPEMLTARVRRIVS